MIVSVEIPPVSNIPPITYNQTITKIHYAAEGGKSINQTYWSVVVYDINGVLKTYTNNHSVNYTV